MRVSAFCYLMVRLFPYIFPHYKGFTLFCISRSIRLIRNTCKKTWGYLCPFFKYTYTSNTVFERLVLESLEDNNDKRGWNDEEEVKNCVMTARRVTGIRLNINHDHPYNTPTLKHLNPHLALVIQGEKDDNSSGRLVLAVLTDNEIRVVTILQIVHYSILSRIK